jgi:hypothetical protein
MRIFSFHRSGGPIMNLISGIHNFCEKREYIFNILPKYNIITLSFFPHPGALILAYFSTGLTIVYT